MHSDYSCLDIASYYKTNLLVFLCLAFTHLCYVLKLLYILAVHILLYILLVYIYTKVD